MVKTNVTQQLKTVKYPRRHWLFTYPAGTGTDSHRRAILSGLEVDYPEVVDEVRVILYTTKRMEQADQIADRAIRAAFIIQDKKINPPLPFSQPGACLNEIARVKGSRGEDYILVFDGEEVFCDCMDFQLENAPILPSGQRACKHVIAALIVEAIKEENAGAEVKF